MSEHDIRLLPPLSAERRASIPAWVGAELREVLDAPEESPIAAVFGAARVLRAAAGASEDRAELSRWVGAGVTGPLLGAVVERALDACSEALGALMEFCESSPEARSTLAVELGREIEAHEAAAPADPKPAMRAVLARDQVESAAWVLGLAVRHASDSNDASLGETRVLESAAGVDEIGQALRTELTRALRGSSQRPWLARVAGLDDGWWLDAWSVPSLSAVDLAGLLQTPVSNVVTLRPPRSRLEQPMAVAASSATSARDRALEESPGPVLARLLGGQVEVYAEGSTTRSPPGLVVGTGEDVPFAELQSVRLDPPSTVAPERDEVAEAWWVPLGATGGDRRALVVQLVDGRSERLEIAPE